MCYSCHDGTTASAGLKTAFIPRRRAIGPRRDRAKGKSGLSATARTASQAVQARMQT